MSNIYILQASFELHKHIGTQMYRCTQFVLLCRSERGSGFITELVVKEQKKCLLITCNHVLQSLSAAQESNIYFGRVGNDKQGMMIKGKDLFHCQYFKTDNTHVSLCLWLYHLPASFPMTYYIYIEYAQVDGWGKRLDYTAVEVKMDVLRRHLKDEVPKLLSLTKYAEWMKSNSLHVDDLLYIVHYPRQQGFYRCTNAEHIHVLQGRLEPNRD